MDGSAAPLSAQNSPAWPWSSDTSGVINGLKLRGEIQRMGEVENKNCIKSELDIMVNSSFFIIVLAWKGRENCSAHAHGNRHFCNYANFRTIGHQTKKKYEIS